MTKIPGDRPVYRDPATGTFHLFVRMRQGETDCVVVHFPFATAAEAVCFAKGINFAAVHADDVRATYVSPDDCKHRNPWVVQSS